MTSSKTLPARYTRAELAAVLRVSQQLLAMRARQEAWPSVRIPGPRGGSSLAYPTRQLPGYVREALDRGTALPSRLRGPRQKRGEPTTRVARRLERALRQAGRTATEVSKAVGKAANTLHGVLAGSRRCSPDLALRLERQLPVDADVSFPSP